MFFMSAIGESRCLRYCFGAAGATPARRAVGGAAHPLAQAVVVRHQPGDPLAEGDHAGTGERGEVDDRDGRLLDGEAQAVGQDQPPLGVGVEDLDRRARSGW
jgi:hypothetical protein